MGERITLKASDGFELTGYRAVPEGKARGGVVVIQVHPGALPAKVVGMRTFIS